MTTRRIFAAIEISDDVRRASAAYIQTLRIADVEHLMRWERPEKLHITLKFLPRATEDDLSSIRLVLDAAARGHGAFEAELSGAGAFPDARRPRVLWLGVVMGAASISALAGTIEALARASGIAAEERSFHPHLTIGRVRDSRQARSTVERHLKTALPPLAFTVDHLTLFESKLTAAGSFYSTLSTHVLSA